VIELLPLIIEKLPNADGAEIDEQVDVDEGVVE
jgi:hypothetical protein